MAANGKILVSGASGNVGGSLLKHLAAAGVEVRALTHDESKASALEGRGIGAFVGDLARPETLADAFEGAIGSFTSRPTPRRGPPWERT